MSIYDTRTPKKNPWWKDILGALFWVSLVAVILGLLFGCGYTPYVSVGAYNELREPVYGEHRATCSARVGADKDYFGGKLTVDAGLQHYSGCLDYDDKNESNMLGVEFKYRPGKVK
jgi:hypothetical protein